MNPRRLMPFFFWSPVLLLAFGLLAAMPSQAARADMIVVTNDNDSGAGSLRQAIADARPGDTIVFDGDYVIPLSSTLVITQPLMIDGGSFAVTVSGEYKGYVVVVSAAGGVTLSHLSIMRGYGPVISNESTLTLQNCVVADSIAFSGAYGIFNTGMLIVQSSVIAGNRAVWGDSAGIWNEGILVARNSSIVNNTSTHTAAGIVNSSFLELQNCTIVGNWGAYAGEGIRAAAGSTLNYRNTLIAYNGRSAFFHGSSDLSPECSADIVGENVNNLVEDGTCGAALSGDPLLGPLLDNGGNPDNGVSLPTLALLPGSPAIDAGDNASCPATDQRGFPRPYPEGGRCDIGAYEAMPALVIAKSVTPAVNAPYHGEVTYTIVLRNAGIGEVNAGITDSLPAQVDFGRWIVQPAGATVTDDRLNWNGVMPEAASITATFTAMHTGAYGDVVSNTVVFDGPNTGRAHATFAVTSAPVADDDTFTVTEDSRNTLLDVLAGDTDPDGDGVRVFAVGMPDQGGVAFNATTFISYTPAVNFAGQETFTYTVSDGNGGLDTAAVTVTVTPLPTYTLSLAIGGSGSALAGGAITADPDLPVYKAGTPVTLTATPAEGWYFGGWSGDLNTADSVEHLMMDGNKAVTATFVTTLPLTHTLTIAVVGNGSGVVTPTVGVHTYISGTLVALGATPHLNSGFAGWSGAADCAGGQVPLDADKTCTATFVLERRFLYLPLVIRHLP